MTATNAALHANNDYIVEDDRSTLYNVQIIRFYRRYARIPS